MFCRKCGQPIDTDTTFCANCGAKVPDEDLALLKKQAAKSKVPLIIGTTIASLAIVIAVTTGAIMLRNNSQNNSIHKETSKNKKENKKEKNQSTESTEISEKVVMPDEKEMSESEKSKLYSRYADILAAMSLGGYYPEEYGTDYNYKDFLTEFGNEMYPDSYNQYCITDIDNDGIDELLVSVTQSCMADMRFVVYNYDLQKEEVQIEISEFPSPVFYENGTIEAGLSHNQGIGDAIWPYDAYRYNSQTDGYEWIGAASSWDGDLYPNGYGNESFPTDIDKDGDKIIYMVTKEDGTSVNMDNAEYDAWEKEIFGDKKEIDIYSLWQDIKMDNYYPLTEAYIKDCIKQGDRTLSKGTTDIGSMYMSDKDTEPLKEKLESKLGTKFVPEDDYEEYEYLNYADEECFGIVYQDGGGISYANNAVDNVTMCGVYPGMTESEAKKSIEAYGFVEEAFEYNDPENKYYKTSDAPGSFYISYEVKDGKITRVSMNSGCKFAG